MIIKWQVTRGPVLRIYFKISGQKDQRGIVKVQVDTRMRAVGGGGGGSLSRSYDLQLVPRGNIIVVNVPAVFRTMLALNLYRNNLVISRLGVEG